MISILLILFWMGVIPLCVGLWPVGLLPEKRRSIGMVLVIGYVCSIALFECLYLIFVLLGSTSSKNLTIVFSIVILIVAIVSGILGRRQFAICLQNWKGMKWSVPAVLFLLVLAVQLVMAGIMQVSDGDDAFFVATANIAAQTDSMNVFLPYTGIATPDLDIRHVFSGLPIWIAALSKLTHVHAAIMCHLVLGEVVLLIHYAILLEIGRGLFEEWDHVWLFSFVAGFFNIFANVSLFTAQTFLLTRTWQGKTMLANVAIPLCFLLLLILYREKTDKRSIVGISLLLAVTYLFAGTCATTGFILLLPLIVVGVVWILLLKRVKTEE